MEWHEIAKQETICLNLGGGNNCHSKQGYTGFIAVDLAPPQSDWSVNHDLRKKIPLPDGSVKQIHTEDFLEHITIDEIKRLLEECFRVLAKGGMMRIGVPDYNNPKDRFCIARGVDPRDPKHITMTTYPLLKSLIESSSFTRHTFYHYWDGEQFVQHPIDYTKGMIKRTPDNDPHCRPNGLIKKIRYGINDFAYILSKGFHYSQNEFITRKGHRLNVTSIVVDLFKE